MAALTPPPIAPLQAAATWLTHRLAEAAPEPLVLAWIANALLAADPASPGARAAVLQLAAAAGEPGAAPRWLAPESTPLGSHGAAAQAEVCAAAVLALRQAGSQPELAEAGADILLESGQPNGGYGSPAATALAIVAEQRPLPPAAARTPAPYRSR